MKIQPARGLRAVTRVQFPRAESDQQSLKVGIYSFPAWRSAFKRVSVDPRARHL